MDDALEKLNLSGTVIQESTEGRTMDNERRKSYEEASEFLQEKFDQGGEPTGSQDALQGNRSAWLRQNANLLKEEYAKLGNIFSEENDRKIASILSHRASLEISHSLIKLIRLREGMKHKSVGRPPRILTGATKPEGLKKLEEAFPGLPTELVLELVFRTPLPKLIEMVNAAIGLKTGQQFEDQPPLDEEADISELGLPHDVEARLRNIKRHAPINQIKDFHTRTSLGIIQLLGIPRGRRLIEILAKRGVKLKNDYRRLTKDDYDKIDQLRARKATRSEIVQKLGISRELLRRILNKRNPKKQNMRPAKDFDLPMMAKVENKKKNTVAVYLYNGRSYAWVKSLGCYSLVKIPTVLPLGMLIGRIGKGVALFKEQ